MDNTALVETIDLATTLLDAAGLAIPESMQGRSLVPILTGEADPARHKAHVVSESYDAIGGRPDHSHASMVFDGRWKSVVYHGHAVGELFDTVADPQEFDNLWDAAGGGGLKLDRRKYHVDAMMATISVGPPRLVDY